MAVIIPRLPPQCPKFAAAPSNIYELVIIIKREEFPGFAFPIGNDAGLCSYVTINEREEDR